MQVSGVEETWKTIRELGDKDYCTVGAEKEAGLSSAIGSCGTRLTDHTNAMASLGRMGAYIPQTAVLEVTNSNGDSLLKYKNEKPKQVIDAQAAYVVNDIMADRASRQRLLGSNSLANLNGSGIRASVKTGTSDISINGKPYSKDLWAVGYTPSLAMSVWLGNPDNTPLTTGRGNSRIPMYILDKVLADTTKQYQEQNKLAADYWTRPEGIQVINGDIYPSYFNRANAPQNIKMEFDRLSKKRATECTPDLARESIEVTKILDPITKRESITAPDGYDANATDDIHSCGDLKPSVSITVNSGHKTATVSYNAGKFTLQTIEVSVDGQVIKTQAVSGSGELEVKLSGERGNTYTVTATATDTGFYQGVGTGTFKPN
jgi:membrane peptidoglycan carboxypeptidase